MAATPLLLTLIFALSFSCLLIKNVPVEAKLLFTALAQIIAMSVIALIASKVDNPALLAWLFPANILAGCSITALFTGAMALLMYKLTSRNCPVLQRKID